MWPKNDTRLVPQNQANSWTDALEIQHDYRWSRHSVSARTQLSALRALCNHELVFRADEPWFRSLDTIGFAARPGGTEIRYDADLRLGGLAFLLDPLVHLGFQLSGKRSADGLRRALNALPRAV